MKKLLHGRGLQNMECFKLFICAILFLLSSLCLATPYYGLNFSYALYAKEPLNLKGFQLLLNYDPGFLQWRRWNLYFDGGIAHLWMNNSSSSSNRSINIYSIAPIARFNFKTNGCIFPYLDLSIGFAYLNRTRIDHRNLGIHFSFQDRAGIGFLFGQKKQLSLGMYIVHYSNARLSSHNSGITIPLMLDVGYRFY